MIEGPTEDVLISMLTNESKEDYAMRVMSAINLADIDYLKKMSCSEEDIGVLARTYIRYHGDNESNALLINQPINTQYEPITKDTDYEYLLFILKVMKDMSITNIGGYNIIKIMTLGYHYSFRRKETNSDSKWVSFLDKEFLSKKREYPWRGSFKQLTQLHMLHYIFGLLADNYYIETDTKLLSVINIDEVSDVLDMTPYMKSGLYKLLNELDSNVKGTLRSPRQIEIDWLGENCININTFPPVPENTYPGDGIIII